MSKEGLYSDAAPVDLGPSAFVPLDGVGRTTQISAKRLPQLRAQLRLLAPQQPGIYAMLNADQEIIYVGKAKDLRKRLFCYFRTKGRDRKAKRIVSRARSIVWEVLPTEFTALLRELELIRRWRPIHNVQGQPLRRRHAYICLGRRPAPHLLLTRKIPPQSLAVFGPVPVTMKSRNAVRWLNDAFELRDCPPGRIAFFPNPNPLFPIAPPSGCLRHEMGTCIGPCTAEVSRTDYHRRARAARAFLEGADRSLIAAMEARMHAAAQAQRFEAAALLRDKTATLTWLTERLDGLKNAQKTLSFIYPIAAADGRTIWYFLHGARVMGCTLEPHDAATAAAALELLQRIYGSDNTQPLLDAYEPIDGMILILSWFRKFPRQRRRGLTPAAARRLATDHIHLPNT